MDSVATFIHHDVCPSSSPRKHYRIVFIPGNPGLIAYYGLFLQHLKSTFLQSPLQAKTRCGLDICGRSLFGFEITHDCPTDSTKFDCLPSASAPRSTLSLTEQIDHVQSLVETFGDDPNFAAGEQPGLILIGHSVGAFILLEILHRFSLITTSQENAPRVVGAICLFPTILDIAKSSAGQKAKWLLQLPCLALLISGFVRLLTCVLSDLTLTRIVACMTGFPKHAALATVAFLRSRRGVFQALVFQRVPPSGETHRAMHSLWYIEIMAHLVPTQLMYIDRHLLIHESRYMAKDEMRYISADRWGEEVWGSPETQRRPLFFYFGEKDHWVAESTRDYLISTRAGRDRPDDYWKPVMEIDRVSASHAFCIRHNNVIAEKCHSYIQSIVQADQSVQGLTMI